MALRLPAMLRQSVARLGLGPSLAWGSGLGHAAALPSRALTLVPRAVCCLSSLAPPPPGIWTTRPVEWGEELTLDYACETESEKEWHVRLQGGIAHGGMVLHMVLHGTV